MTRKRPRSTCHCTRKGLDRKKTLNLARLQSTPRGSLAMSKYIRSLFFLCLSFSFLFTYFYLFYFIHFKTSMFISHVYYLKKIIFLLFPFLIFFSSLIFCSFLYLLCFFSSLFFNISLFHYSSSHSYIYLLTSLFISFTFSPFFS